jgi:site-specific recombinase XerD
MTINEAHQKFLDFLRSKKRASATIVAYGKDINQVLTFAQHLGKTEIDQITQEEIEAFLKKLQADGYTPKSISRKINSIKTFYRFMKANGMIQADPSVNITHPKYEIKPPRILSKLEYRALRDAARDDIRMSAIIELLLQTGIRIGELANILVNDIKETTLVIRPQEGHAEREIPLNKAVMNALNRYLSIRPKTDDKALFITKTGHPLLIRNIRTAIDRYFRLAGIKDAKVNDLRHTWIAYQLMSGANVVLVSKLSGHKRLSTTEKYLELIKGTSEEPIKLGEL